jgi:hypothetical protein
VLKQLPVPEDDVSMGWDMNWQSAPSVHNFSIYCTMGLGLHLGQSGSFERPDSSGWSLKEVGVQNHLLLRSDKSIYSWLRHRWKIMCDGVENRSSRQRIDVDAGPRVGALLGLSLLLALA